MKKNGMMVGLLLGLLVIWSSPTLAQEDLFELTLPLSPPLDTVDETRLMKRAVEQALHRLTGRLHLPESTVAFFTRSPRRWVERFAVEPRLEDGVPIGRQARMRFNRQVLLRAMQEKGLRYWPATSRPRLLIAPVLITGRRITPLTAADLRMRSDLDMMPLLEMLGLHAVLPEAADNPALRQPILDRETVRSLAQRYDVDGILRMTFTEAYRDRQKVVTLDWEWIPQNGKMQRGHLTGQTVRPLMESMFEQLVQQWRQHQSENAAADDIEFDVSLQGEARVVLMRPSVASVEAFERFVQQYGDQLVQLVMTALTVDEAVYRLRYRGNWQALMQRLRQLPDVVSVEADPATRQVQLVLSEPIDQGAPATP